VLAPLLRLLRELEVRLDEALLRLRDLVAARFFVAPPFLAVRFFAVELFVFALDLAIATPP